LVSRWEIGLAFPELENAVAGAEAHVGVYHFDQFRLDVERGTLHGPGESVLIVRPKAFALLRYLVENPGRLHGRTELLETLWPGVVVTDDSLTQCISDLRHAFGDRAPHVLRTVPRRGYMLTATVSTDTTAPEPPQAPPLPIAASGRAGLLILEPFAHFGDEAAADVAAVLSTELLTELTRFEGIRVAAAPQTETADAYRIRGEVRLAGGTLRITARLEDAARGAALWAERLDLPRGTTELPAGVPAGVVQRLSAALVHKAEQEDLRRARQKPQSALSVRELCLLGKEHQQRGNEADTLVALDLFQQAVAADPNYALAYAWLAFTVQRVDTYGWGPPAAAKGGRDRALACARRAVELDPDSPLCLSRLAYALLLHRRWDEAVMTARAALRAGRPTDYASLNTCAEVLGHGGYPDEAIEAFQQALSLDPHCPPMTRSLLGRALVLAGKPEEALPELRWAAAHLPDYVPSFHSLVVAAVETGRMEAARAALREAVRLLPHWEPRNYTGPWYFRRASDVERFETAFRAAGLADMRIDPPDDNGTGQRKPRRSVDRGPTTPSTPAAQRANDLTAMRPAGTA
jgi:DNA-binding winged helix-turn-helix (wHTH) protein/tetratricopeptide (TPR) repeat protein